METARNGGASGRAAERDARSLKRAAREAAERAAGNPEVEKLIADVEALIDRLGDAGIRRWRTCARRWPMRSPAPSVP